MHCPWVQHPLPAPHSQNWQILFLQISFLQLPPGLEGTQVPSNKVLVHFRWTAPACTSDRCTSPTRTVIFFQIPLKM